MREFFTMAAVVFFTFTITVAKYLIDNESLDGLVTCLLMFGGAVICSLLAIAWKDE